MQQEWTTVIVAPTLAVAESDDYIDPWPGSPVSRAVVGHAPWRRLEGARYERVAVREPQAYEASDLALIRNTAVTNALRIRGSNRTAVFAISTKASAVPLH